MTDPSAGEGVRMERRQRLAAFARDAEPTDWATALVPLIERAETAGADDVRNELQLEIWANGTHAQMSGRPQRSARFSFIPPPLNEPRALALLAQLAGEREAPPQVRAHEWDLVWSSERSPRTYPLAGVNAAQAYLEHARAVGDDVFDDKKSLGARFQLLDALARAAQLARETSQPALAAEIREETRRRLSQIPAHDAYRYLLELGYALLDTEAIAPGGLADLDALIEPAVKHFKAHNNFDLARAALQLAIDARRDRDRNDPQIESFEERIAASYVEDANLKKAAGASATLVAWVLRDAVAAYQKLPNSAAKVAELTARLDEANLGSLADLKPVTGNLNLPGDKVDALVAAFAEQSFEDALMLVGGDFLQNRAAAYERSERSRKEFALSSLVTLTVLTAYGQTINLPAGTQERIDHDAFRDAMLSVSLNDEFLRMIFERLRARGLTVEQVMAAIGGSPFVTAESRALIQDGLTKWYGGDMVGAVHVLTPQLEAVLRSILRAIGVPVVRVNGAQVSARLLKELLKLAGQYGLPDEILFTMEIVLTERGSNVRNKVAHGWVKLEECTPGLVARLVHLLLALASLRAQDTAA